MANCHKTYQVPLPWTENTGTYIKGSGHMERQFSVLLLNGANFYN